MEDTFNTEEILTFFKQEKYVLIFLIIFHSPNLSVIKLVRYLKEESMQGRLTKLNNLDSLFDRTKLYPILNEMKSKRILVTSKHTENGYRTKEVLDFSINSVFLEWFCKSIGVEFEQVKLIQEVIPIFSNRKFYLGIADFLSRYPKRIEFATLSNYFSFLLYEILCNFYSDWDSCKEDEELARSIINLDKSSQEINSRIENLEDVVFPFQNYALELEHQEFEKYPKRKRKL